MFSRELFFLCHIFRILWDVSQIKLECLGEYVEDLKPILVTKAILNLKLNILNCFAEEFRTNPHNMEVLLWKMKKQTVRIKIDPISFFFSDSENEKMKKQA